MFTKVVKLSDLRLTSEQDKLQLSICSSAEFHLPDRFSTSVDKDIIRELIDGGIWASRGAQCHLDLVLSIDGKVLQDSNSFHLIEAIAYRLRNAPIWKQLSLLASVAVQHPCPPDESLSHVSIALTCGSKLEAGDMALEVDMQLNVQLPESVWCAKFTCLRIQCDFSSIQVQAAEPNTMQKAPPVTFFRQIPVFDQSGRLEQISQSVVETPASPSLKKVPTISRKKKPVPKTPLSNGTVLLDESMEKREPRAILPKTPLSRQMTLLDESTQASEQIARLPQTPFANSSDLHTATPESHVTPQKRKQAPAKNSKGRTALNVSPDPFVKEEIVETPSLSSTIHTPSYKRQKILPGTPTPQPVSKVPSKKGVTAKTLQNHEMVRTWVEQNRSNPYPTKDQLQTLLSDTGYSRRHLLGLLAKSRTSVLAAIIKIEPALASPSKSPHGQALPIEPLQSTFKLALNLGLENEMLLDENDDAPYDMDDDDMLLDPLDESLPWFDSNASPLLLSSTPGPGTVYYELAPLEFDHSVAGLMSSIAIPVACQLIETALRFLVGGQQRLRRGIKTDPINPQLSLSILIPSLFDFGFKKLMSQNARFLPTITTAMCVTLVKNKQGAELRKKLFLLAFAARELDEELNGKADMLSPKREMRMQDVVQRKLWSMMHRKLQDPHSARNLRHTTSDGVKNKPIFEDDEDLFAGLNYDSQDSQDSQRSASDYDNGQKEFKSLLEDQIHGGGGGEPEKGGLLNDSSALIFDDGDEEFEDLFLSGNHDDEDLISYLDGSEAERERREIERETEEILLDDFPDDNDDYMLFEDHPADTSDMLLGNSHMERLTDGREHGAGRHVLFARTRSLSEAPLGVGWR